METDRLDSGGGRGCRGYALLLMLVITLALGMIIWHFGFGEKGPDRKTRRMQQQWPEQYPWVEEWRIKGSKMRRPRNVEDQEASEDQPQFTQVMLVETEVWKDSGPRGKVWISIGPDGSVNGNYGADYNTMSPRMNLTFHADFKGNTDASKWWTDEDGRSDASRLFLISKGEFWGVESNFENGKVRRVGGHIYVTGWIDREQMVSGRVHLTSDKQTQKIFEYSGEAIPAEERSLW